MQAFFVLFFSPGVLWAIIFAGFSHRATPILAYLQVPVVRSG